MTEESESPTDATATTTVSGRPSRLNQIAAWVGIVAGIVFVVAVIFFSGFYAGAYSTRGYWHGGYRHQQWQQGPGCSTTSGPMGSGGMMGSGGGMMGPGMMGPGTSGPAMPGPGMMPGQPSPAPVPHHP